MRLKKLTFSASNERLDILFKTSKKEMLLRPGQSDHTKEYVNASLEDDAGRKSRRRTRFLVLYGDAAVAATSIWLKFAGLRSAEAGNLELSEAAKTIMRIRGESSEQKIKQKLPKEFQDSCGCINLTAGSAARYFNKLRHIDVEHHHAMSLVEQRYIILMSVRTFEKRANFLTQDLLPDDTSWVLPGAQRFFSYGDGLI